MKKYAIPNTNLNISRIGMGCMGFGIPWDNSPLGDEHRQNAARIVQAALDAGINFFDHADIYSMGKCEQAFSAIWEKRSSIRDQIVLQSKCGIRFADSPNPDDPHRFDFSYEHITESAEGSLRRLGTDYLDIYLLHRPDPLVEPEEVARAFDDLHQAGKVRYFGVSNHTPAQIRLLSAYLKQPLVVNQIEFNILHSHILNEGISYNQNAADPKLAEGTVEHARLNNIMLQAWAPVAGGRLFKPAAESGDQRTDATSALLRQMADQYNTTPDAIAIAWILRHPAGIQPLLGTGKPERVNAATLADKIELSRDDWYRLFTAGRGSALP